MNSHHMSVLDIKILYRECCINGRNERRVTSDTYKATLAVDIMVQPCLALKKKLPSAAYHQLFSLSTPAQ